jgi:hypothetical protein
MGCAPVRKVRACGLNRHAYMHAYGVNRCACVCACGENSRAFEAKMRVRKLISLFFFFFGGEILVFL